jgi:hypothetical protein
LQRTHAVGPRERRPRADQLIEVRRSDVPIAQGGDGVGSLIVAEKKKHVRLPPGLAGQAPIAWRPERIGEGNQQDD